MSLKKGGSPAELPVVLTITGQGSTDKLSLVYHNRKTSEVDAKWSEPGMTLGGIIPFIVKSWDTDFPLTEEGMREFEDENPGVLLAVMEGYGIARRKVAEKN